MGGLRLQMSWQPSLLSQERKNGPPLGLRNLGNSCYLNSVLQCLTYTPPLANFCLRSQHSSLCDSFCNGELKRECPFCILENRIVRSLSSGANLDAPAKILNCLRIYAEHFRRGRQEDAHEFLRYVIDACHNTCLRLKKLGRKGINSANGSSTVVKDIFGGALQSQVKCLSCNSESNKVDEIMDISLDILHSGSLLGAMQKFFQSEILDGNNKYKCESCKKLVAARKQMSISQAPNILVIHLKRFEGIFGGKIDKAIAFEEVLVLSSFMCKSSQDPQPEYSLFGTIVHSGFSPESGHYYAYIKDAMGRWYCCNDSFVTLSNLEEVLSEKVYVLFFSRTNPKPVYTKPPLALNGIHSCHQNGSEASKSTKETLLAKPVHSKPLVSGKEVSARSKVDKVTSGTPIKFSITGNSVSKMAPQITNGRVEVHTKANGAVNGTSEGKLQLGKLGNGPKSSVIENGSGHSMKDNATNGESCHPHTVATGSGSSENGAVSSMKLLACKSNGTIHKETMESRSSHRETSNDAVSSVKLHACKSNGTIHKETTQSGPSHHETSNGADSSTKLLAFKNNGTIHKETSESRPVHHETANGASESPVLSGSKRKLKESCVLFALDAQSRAKVDDLKELLKQEAAAFLRSSDWSNEVYTHMSSKKRLCAQEAGTLDLKGMLVTDAKRTFISKIPAALRGTLVKRLQSLSEEK